jgi:hypothetical protein
MAIDLRYAADTNILLRVSFKTHVDHPLIANAIRHLAATLEVHGIRNLLTFNGSDFKRFSKITAVHPADAEPMQLQ